MVSQEEWRIFLCGIILSLLFGTSYAVICSDGENTDCFSTDLKFVQFSNITGNDVCLEISYPRESSGEEAEAEMLAIIPSFETTCVNLFAKNDCSGRYLQFRGTVHGYKLLLPFDRKNFLENFPLQPKSIQPSECYSRWSTSHRRGGNTEESSLINNYKNGLELKLVSQSPGETAEITVLPGNDACFRFTYGQSISEPLDLSTLPFYNVTLKLSNNGQGMPPLCLELFSGPKCNRASVRAFIPELAHGHSINLWRLAGKYGNRTVPLTEGTLVDLSSESPKIFKVQSAKPCHIPSDQGTNKHSSSYSGGGVRVEVVTSLTESFFASKTSTSYIMAPASTGSLLQVPVYSLLISLMGFLF